MTLAAENQKKGIPVRSVAGYLRRLVVITILLNLVFLGAVYWILQEGKHQYELRAQAASENISKALSGSLGDELDKIDLIIQSTCDEIGHRLAGGVGMAGMNSRLATLRERLPELNAITVADAKGVIRHSAGVNESLAASIWQENYFSHLRTHPEAGAIIAGPIYGQVSRRWVIVVARACRSPDGAFGGVVSASVDVDQLIRIFSRLDVGRHGFVTLRDSDFVFMARHPKLGDGKFIGERTLSKEFRGLIEAGRDSGTFRAVSPFDGRVRTISFNKVGNWPLNVSAGLSADDYLAVWRTAARNCIVTAGIISLFSIFAAWLLYRDRKDKVLYIDMLQRNESMFRCLAEMSSDWIWEQDREFRFTHIAGNPDSKSGVNGEYMLGKTRWDLAIDADDFKWTVHRAELEAHLPFQDFEYDCLDGSGSKHTFLVSGKPVFDSNGVFQGYRGVTKDITERKVYEERIRHMAQHDSLTQLPNRLMFYDRVGQAVKTARRKGIKFALFYIDLDNFKLVNDRFGHGVGDRVLMEVASRMQAKLRESDTLSRLGGDEFALILPEITNSEDIHAVIQKLVDAMAAPFELVDVPEQIVIGLSIGIAVFPQDRESVDKLVRAADEAMYRAKREGNSYCFFSSEEVRKHSF